MIDKFQRFLVSRFSFILILIFLTGCNSKIDESLMQTQISLAVQQTEVSKGMTQISDQATIDAQGRATDASQITATIAPTTIDDSKPTLTPTPTVVDQPSSTPTESNTQTPDYPLFDDWKKSAKILVLEDIAPDRSRKRWILMALDNLGLSYVDMADALGNFQYELTSGEEWDLIIYARENRNNREGNLFIDLFAEFDNGSSIVMEQWNLDDVLDTSWTLTLFMENNGFYIKSDLAGPPKQLLYNHNRDHPVHNYPNSDVKLTSFNEYLWDGDLGDLIEIEKPGQCLILYGVSQAYDMSNGTVVTCFDNRFILQTHPTHQYERIRSIRIWENYIYHALTARYEYLKGIAE